MSFFEVLREMMVILFAIALGYLARCKAYLNDQFNEMLSKLIMTITLPCMIVGAVLTGDALPGTGEILSVLKVSVVFYAMGILAALVLPRFLGGTPLQKGVWRYGLVFPNMAFIGYPVVVGVYGAEALFYAVILVLPFNLLTYTLGPLLLVGAKQMRWQQFCSPTVIAAVISLVLALTGLRPPAVVGECLNFVGDVTVTMSLITVGSLLAGLPVRQVFASPRLWIFSLIRLLALPIPLFLILREMNGVDAVVMGVAVLEMAMPVAINGSMMCMEYGGDTKTMAQVTFLSTLLSMVTIPLIAAVLL